MSNDKQPEDQGMPFESGPKRRMPAPGPLPPPDPAVVAFAIQMLRENDIDPDTLNAGQLQSFINASLRAKILSIASRDDGSGRRYTYEEAEKEWARRMQKLQERYGPLK